MIEAYCMWWNCYIKDMPEWQWDSCGVDSCIRGKDECPSLRCYRREGRENFEND